MSAQRSVPPPRPTAALIAALVLGAALGAGATLVLRDVDRGHASRTTATGSSPDKSFVATAAEKPCANGDGWCAELRVGKAGDAGRVVAGYEAPAARCDEIVWTPDGKRVGFVVGHELRLFDPQSLKEIGTVRLVSEDAALTRRVRGVTFSDNGRAVTFDDCPRTHSGCRAGVVGIPQ